MKKVLLSLSAAVMAVATTQAQDSKIGLAPEVGVGMVKTNMDGAKYNLGYKAGVNVLLPITESFSIAPGVFYSAKGFKYKETVGGTSISYKQSLGYIEVPVNLMYEFRFDDGSSFFPFAGPYAGYGITANHDVKFGSDADKVKAFDFGFNFGIGYKASFGGFVRAQYQLGLGNLSNVDGVKYHNTGFGLSVGYVF